MTIADGLLILAALSGPVLAVQAQMWIERAREKRNRRQNIFSSLMMTRATRLASEHVQALNMIDLEFTGAKDKPVRDAWALYSDHLNTPQGKGEAAAIAWHNQSDELFVDLLLALSKSLGFDFDKVKLKRGIYYPVGHGEIELSQRIVREGLADLLAGKASLPMSVVDFPVSQEALAKQTELQDKLLKALSGEATLSVKMTND